MQRTRPNLADIDQAAAVTNDAVLALPADVVAATSLHSMRAVSIASDYETMTMPDDVGPARDAAAVHPDVTRLAEVNGP